MCIHTRKTVTMMSLSDILNDSCPIDSSYKCNYQASVNQRNIALHQTQLINQLCTCDNKTLKWCFIHSKARDPLDLITNTNKFGFIPTCSIEFPLYKPMNNLEAEELQQWAFQPHWKMKSTNVFYYKEARIQVPTELHVDHWRALCGNYHDKKSWNTWNMASLGA